MKKWDDGASVLAGMVCFCSGGQFVQGSTCLSLNTYFGHSRLRMFHCLSFQPIQFLSNWLKFKIISDGTQLYEHFS